MSVSIFLDRVGCVGPDDDEVIVAQILEYHHDVLARRSVAKNERQLGRGAVIVRIVMAARMAMNRFSTSSAVTSPGPVMCGSFSSSQMITSTYIASPAPSLSCLDFNTTESCGCQ